MADQNANILEQPEAVMSATGSPAGVALPPARIASVARDFRYDINALRGIAASVVVLFHFGVAPFQGGFVGVDIFFVISGLLMTQIIARGIDRGDFSVLGFYGARARRIVPALAVLCAVLSLLGLVLLDPLTLGDLARNALSSLLFYSNMLYATQSGYFAEASDTNWLLHTWTLSVEWQFYLVYPIILSLAARWRWLWARRAATLGIVCILGFAATMFVASRSQTYQDYAFFLLPTRAWEMLAGGWLAVAAPQLGGTVLRHKAARQTLLLSGLAAIILSIVLLDRFTPWPSPWLLLPVAGTVAVLAAEQSQAWWTRLPGLQLLGTWSYSIYLWHWPIVAALQYFHLPHSPAVIAACLALTVALGFTSYSLAETALRGALFGKGSGSPIMWLRFAAGFLLLSGTTALLWRTDGLEQVRIAGMQPGTAQRLADYRAATDDWRGMEPCGGTVRLGTARICVLGKGNPRRVAILGDSHAEQMLPRLAQLAKRENLEITMVRQPGCPPLSELEWTVSGNQCRLFAKAAFDTVERGHFSRVIILTAWEIYFSQPGGVDPDALCRMGWLGCRPSLNAAEANLAVSRAFTIFAERLRRLRAGGATVALVLPYPIPAEDTPRDYYRRTFAAGRPIMAPPIDRAEFLHRTSGVRALLARAAASAGAATIDAVPARCADENCPVFDNGRYIFRDRHHLRASVIEGPDFSYLDTALVG